MCDKPHFQVQNEIHNQNIIFIHHTNQESSMSPIMLDSQMWNLYITKLILPLLNVGEEIPDKEIKHNIKQHSNI